MDSAGGGRGYHAKRLNCLLLPSPSQDSDCPSSPAALSLGPREGGERTDGRIWTGRDIDHPRRLVAEEEEGSMLFFFASLRRCQIHRSLFSFSCAPEPVKIGRTCASCKRACLEGAMWRAG